MSGLFGTSNKLASQNQRAFGLQVARANTNQQARPVPMIYGQQRVSITFISDVFDILASPVNQSVGKQSQQVGTNYFASFAALVGMGPVDGISDVFLNGEPVFASTTKIYAVALTAAGSTGNLFMTATFQTANAHNRQVGDVVVVLGADQPEYNGEVTITAVPGPKQFQYHIVPTDATPATAHQSGAITAQVRLEPVLREDNPDFADITIPDYGNMRIYWGTETQPADVYLNETSGVAHPAYLGQCYIVFQELFFGFNQTNVPNVEVTVFRYPKPSWGFQPSSIVEDANPAYVVADLFEDERAGLALDDSSIDTAALETAALAFNNEKLGVSNALTRIVDVRSVLKEICETCDALPLLDGEGLLSLQVIRAPGALPAAITDAELSDLPNFAPVDWSSTYTNTKVTFNDRDLAFQDNLAEWRDTGVRNVVQNPDALSLDRKWISRMDLATAIAAASGQAAAVPIVSGKIKLRLSDARFTQLAPGAVFQMNFSKRDTSNRVFRVMARSIQKPDVPELEIDFQADHTYLYTFLIGAGGAQGQSQQGDGGDDPVPPLLGFSTDDRMRLVELPPGLCPMGQGSTVPAIAAVVARNATGATNFSIWLKKNFVWAGDAPDSYSLLQTQTRFALHGLTQADYPATTRLIDLELGVPVQFDGPDQTLEPITAFEALSDNTLAFIDDEILSLADWTLLDAGKYQLKFIRGRFGTVIADHAFGAQVLLVNRATLPIISEPSFQPGNTAAFKLTLGNQDVSAVDEVDLLLAGLAWRVPPPCALAVNGECFNPIYAGGPNPFTVEWALPDPSAILPRFDLVKLFTRLQFGVAGNLIYQTDIPWPSTSAQFTFALLNGGVDAPQFTIAAATVCSHDLDTILSGSQSLLNVTKYP